MGMEILGKTQDGKIDATVRYRIYIIKIWNFYDQQLKYTQPGEGNLSKIIEQPSNKVQLLCAAVRPNVSSMAFCMKSVRLLTLAVWIRTILYGSHTTLLLRATLLLCVICTVPAQSGEPIGKLLLRLFCKLLSLNSLYLYLSCVCVCVCSPPNLFLTLLAKQKP